MICIIGTLCRRAARRRSITAIIDILRGTELTAVAVIEFYGIFRIGQRDGHSAPCASIDTGNPDRFGIRRTCNLRVRSYSQESRTAYRTPFRGVMRSVAGVRRLRSIDPERARRLRIPLYTILIVSGGNRVLACQI